MEYKFSSTVFVLVVSLSLFSCIVQPSGIEPVLTLTNTPLPKITSTEISLPTPAVVPLTIIPPPTISGISTLSPENAYLELESLLKNDCGLPCFAGITPGGSLLIDASKKLLPFSAISDWNTLNEMGGQFGITYPKDGVDMRIFIDPESTKDSNYVEVLIVRTEALQKIEDGYLMAYDANPYHKIFGVYSLQNILATYGLPTEIYMTVEINEGEYNSPDFVLLWLLYPEKGFIAKYIGNADEIDGTVYGCPSKMFVELWLFPPYKDNRYKEELLSFDENLGYVFPAASPRTKSIFDGMDMTIDEFYQMFNQPTTQCLETPSGNWINWWR